MIDLGDVPPFAIEVRDEQGELVDSTDGVLTITGPDGIPTAVTLEHESVGRYLPQYVATLAGWYRWDYDSTDPQTSSGGSFKAGTRPIWRPSPAQVHALIPVRPAFTATSKPSIDEVEDLIDLALDAVTDETSVGTFPEIRAGKARFVIALSAASMVEQGYFPEQQIGPDSPAQLLYTRYQAELLGLRTILGTASGTPRRVGTIRLAGAPRRDGTCW